VRPSDHRHLRVPRRGPLRHRPGYNLWAVNRYVETIQFNSMRWLDASEVVVIQAHLKAATGDPDHVDPKAIDKTWGGSARGHNFDRRSILGYGGR